MSEPVFLEKKINCHFPWNIVALPLNSHRIRKSRKRISVSIMHSVPAVPSMMLLFAHLFYCSSDWPNVSLLKVLALPYESKTLSSDVCTLFSKMMLLSDASASALSTLPYGIPH